MFVVYSQPVITSSPSEDHTYSAGNENADEADKLNGNATETTNGGGGAKEDGTVGT